MGREGEGKEGEGGDGADGGGGGGGGGGGEGGKVGGGRSCDQVKEWVDDCGSQDRSKKNTCGHYFV